MTVKEFSKKYQISQQAVYAKIKNLQNHFNDKNSEIEKLQGQLAEENLKKSNFDNFADTLKNEILKISYKLDDVQNSIFENTKKSGSSIIGLLKK